MWVLLAYRNLWGEMEAGHFCGVFKSFVKAEEMRQKLDNKSTDEGDDYFCKLEFIETDKLYDPEIAIDKPKADDLIF